MKNKLTLSFIPYSEIDRLDSTKRIKKILDVVLENKIVILQGRLTNEEETSLITSTMTLVGRIKGFKGVELAVISGTNNVGFMSKLKTGNARSLIGERDSLTIIGPASVVKEIKKDPKKIELMLKK